MIEHKDIVDAQRHEPKGASTALVNTSYISNGSGSGSWRKIKSTDLQGLAGDAGNVDHVLVSDGADGFKLKSDIVYGSMTITNNSTNFVLTAVADTSFNTPAQFTLVTGTGAPWVSENLFEVTFNTNRLIVPVTGVYKIDMYMNIGAFPATGAKVAVRYLINGTSYSTRKPTIKSSGAGAEGQLIGFGLLTLNAGDFLQLTVASDSTGNLLIRDLNTTLQLIRAT